MSWDNILANAAKETDETFASRISSLCRLTDEEISSIAPTKSDKERLVELVTVFKKLLNTNRAKSRNDRKN